MVFRGKTNGKGIPTLRSLIMHGYYICQASGAASGRAQKTRALPKYHRQFGDQAVQVAPLGCVANAVTMLRTAQHKL
jgi:hypothetical protein